MHASAPGEAPTVGTGGSPRPHRARLGVRPPLPQYLMEIQFHQYLHGALLHHQKVPAMFPGAEDHPSRGDVQGAGGGAELRQAVLRGALQQGHLAQEGGAVEGSAAILLGHQPHVHRWKTGGQEEVRRGSGGGQEGV
eukprot:383436-Pyramimonas_sp.AAC.1